MGLYNFKPQFHDYVRDGSKAHTIRAKRKTRERPGNAIHCYGGLRTKHTVFLRRSPCVKVEDILITENHRVFVDGAELSPDEKDLLAWKDGFRRGSSESEWCSGSFLLMMTFWDGRLPFEGDIIHWNPAVNLPAKPQRRKTAA